MSQNETLNYWIDIIDKTLDKLYSEQDLFDNDVCERCLVFRFSYHLQLQLEGLFIDCDYNASCKNDWYWNYIRNHWKEIPDEDWKKIKRYVDIIVRSKRDLCKENSQTKNTDIVCFECKKGKNKNVVWWNKDIANLKYLTNDVDGYWYNYWFHLIFWEEKKKCKITVYVKWEEKKVLEFNDEWNLVLQWDDMHYYFIN